jgi:hypothetical protein
MDLLASIGAEEPSKDIFLVWLAQIASEWMYIMANCEVCDCLRLNKKNGKKTLTHIIWYLNLLDKDDNLVEIANDIISRDDLWTS